MKRILKGCLISAIIVCLGIFGVIFFITNNINKSISSDKIKIEEDWSAYTTQLRTRNSILLKDKDLNFAYLIAESEKNIQDNDKKALLSNEYILNDSLRLSGNEIESTNKNLNVALLKYNSDVKAFNEKYSVFPQNILRRQKGIDLYDYFNIDYGKDNTELINEQKRADDWIKNGGEFT